ncbi:hypothetical protein GCM10017673_35180 [Streptosporangium violaceochromogenes]|nr:hypothetical protein GCM10017673_35180 [Streptosporangium violaceochromogenes]
MNDSTSILFGMPEITVVKVEHVADDGGQSGRVVHIERPEDWAACPDCGVISTKVRRRRTTRPRDLPHGQEPLGVRRHKRHFATCADALLIEPEPPEVLGIDETRRGRPAWIKNETSGKWARTERFETNFVDLSGAGALPGQAAGRTGKAVIDWLSERGTQWKSQVRIVAIDPAACSRSAIKQALPHAVIVVDHFHLVALANKALTSVRQRVNREERGRRGRATDPEWANRRRLLRGRERLSERGFTRMWNDLVDHEPTGQILTVWIAKEELRSLPVYARERAPRPVISQRLFRFLYRCAGSGIPELITLAETVDAWWPETLAFITTGIANARTEGTNRLIKDAARVAFGFRNLTDQRRRVRLACTHQTINPAA